MPMLKRHHILLMVLVLVFLPWSQSKIGSVKGVEVSKFGTGFATDPSLSLK